MIPDRIDRGPAISFDPSTWLSEDPIWSSGSLFFLSGLTFGENVLYMIFTGARRGWSSGFSISDEKGDRMKSIFLSALSAGVIGSLTFGCAASAPEIEAVRDFHPADYMGTWYEIVRLPHYFERGLDRVSAEYSLCPDGTIRVVNRGYRAGKLKQVTGKAKLKEPGRKPLTGELRVSFFRPFYSDYRIIELAPDYSYSVVMGSDRSYLWVLSRTPKLPEARLRKILERLRTLGFEVEKLEYPVPCDTGMTP